MSILIFHLCHNQQTKYSWNWVILKNTLLPDLLFQLSLYMSPFSRKKYLSVIINFKLLLPRSTSSFFIWLICSSQIKIIIYPHILVSLSRPKYLSNDILNVQDVIIFKDGFKVMSFPHRYCITYYVNIGFATNFIVESVIVHL